MALLDQFMKRLIEKPPIQEKLVSYMLHAVESTPISKTSRTFPPLAEGLKYKAAPARIEDFLQTYEKSVWVYAAVYAIASSAAGVPFRIFEKSNGERKLLTSGPIVELFSRPNPLISGFELWESTFSYLELTGNCYWEIVSDRNNQPRELYPLRPDRIEVIPDPKTLVKGYKFKINTREILFKPEEILAFKYFSPLDDLYGQSPGSPAEKSITLDLYAMAYNTRFFKEGARILGVLEVDRSLSEVAYKRLREQWRARYAGVHKAFETAILEEGLRYRPISSTHKDMDFNEQRKRTREEVLAAFGVPPAIVGLYEYANYANSYEQKRLFWTETVIPKLKKVQFMVNEHLIKRFGQQYSGEFDFAAIEALKEDEATKAKYCSLLVDAGIFTPNEIRIKFYGEKPRPGGDQFPGPRPRRRSGLRPELEKFLTESLDEKHPFLK